MIEQNISKALIGDSCDFHSSWGIVANFLYTHNETVVAYKPFKNGLERVFVTRTDESGLLVRPENSGKGFAYTGPRDIRADHLIFPHTNIEYYQKKYSNWLAAAHQERNSYTRSEEKEIAEAPFSSYLQRLTIYMDQCMDPLVKADRIEYDTEFYSGPSVCIFMSTPERRDGDGLINATDALQNLLIENRDNRDLVGINEMLEPHAFNFAGSKQFTTDAYLMLEIYENDETEMTPEEALPYLKKLYAKLANWQQNRKTSPDGWDETEKILKEIMQKKDGIIRIRTEVTAYTSPLYQPSLINVPEDEFSFDLFELKFYFFISCHEGK